MSPDSLDGLGRRKKIGVNEQTDIRFYNEWSISIFPLAEMFDVTVFDVYNSSQSFYNIKWSSVWAIANSISCLENSNIDDWLTKIVELHFEQ